MNWNSKHTCTVESVLNRKCLYCISLKHGERLLTVIKEIYDKADDANVSNISTGLSSALPYRAWPLSDAQHAIDQEVADTLFNAITRSQDKKADVISPWFTYRQLQRCANLIWDFHAVQTSCHGVCTA